MLRPMLRPMLNKLYEPQILLDRIKQTGAEGEHWLWRLSSGHDGIT
jgi:hypothetical protein